MPPVEVLVGAVLMLVVGLTLLAWDVVALVLWGLVLFGAIAGWVVSTL